MLFNNVLLLLLSNAVTLRRDKSILFYRTASIVFSLISFLGLSSLVMYSLKNVISIYSGLFNINSTTHIFHVFIFGITAIILALSGVFPRKILFKNINEYLRLHNLIVSNYKSEQFKIIEYPLMILFIVTGGTFLICSNDVVSVFISIELQSYGLYLLAVLYKNSELSTNAGLTYFLLGGLSSCFILLGSGLLYSNSGITSMESLYIANDIWMSAKQYIFNFSTSYLGYALVIVIVGFLFKISAAPFHFWSPDVYDAIPTIATTFVAIIPKISILVFIYGIVHFTCDTLFNLDFDWRYTLLISSLLSLIIGTVLGLNQFRIKRLFAYSTISHLGFILLALSINNIESTQAFMFYLMQYSISNLNAFILLLIIGYSLYLYRSGDLGAKLKEKKNSPIQLLSQLKGYFNFNPIIAISLTITIYSFVGIPPLVGFFAKQMVLSAALSNGLIFMSLIAILTSVISAVYYLNIIKQIFFDKFEYNILSYYNYITKKYTIKLSGIFSNLISMFTLIILLFILQPQEWLSLTSLMSLFSFNP